MTNRLAAAKQKKEKAVRFNITLPPELRARMEAAPQANWSALAAEAFRRWLFSREDSGLSRAGGDCSP